MTKLYNTHNLIRAALSLLLIIITDPAVDGGLGLAPPFIFISVTDRSSLVSDAQKYGVTDQLNLLLSCAEAFEISPKQPMLDPKE